VWTHYRAQVHCLGTFHISCLQRILGITWKVRVPYVQLLQRANFHSLTRLWCSSSSATSLTSLKCWKTVFYGRFSMEDLLWSTLARWAEKKKNLSSICSPLHRRATSHHRVWRTQLHPRKHRVQPPIRRPLILNSTTLKTLMSAVNVDPNNFCVNHFNPVLVFYMPTCERETKYPKASELVLCLVTSH